jgi:glutamyl-tRNA synthetase
MLHVGGIRTALYSWLVAKQAGGHFFLRLEDTDQERYVAGSPRQIIESFQWLGLDLDGGPDHADLRAMKQNEDFDGALDHGEYRGVPGPFVQSRRLEIYKAHAEQLIASGRAYRADETSEELEVMRKTAEAERRNFVFTEASRIRTEIDPATPHVIRFKIARQGKTVLNDAVLGEVVFENANLASDPVILKSDGFPTYHLAAMVDDHLQGVTHVIRAQEWLASAPTHVQIIEALGWPVPVFAHVPPVNGADGKKLSKRTGAQSVFEFRDQGYLKEALLNFLTMLGWAPGAGSTQNVFTLDELIAQFELGRVTKSPAIFEYPKLDWLNEQHIQRLAPEVLTERLIPFLARDGVVIDTPAKRERLIALVPLINTRIKKLTDAGAMVDFFFAEPTPLPAEQLLGPKMERHLSLHALRAAIEATEKIAPFDDVTLERELRALADSLQLKPNQLFTIIRNAVSGRQVTPPLFGSMVVLGRDTVLARMRTAASTLSVAG